MAMDGCEVLPFKKKCSSPRGSLKDDIGLNGLKKNRVKSRLLRKGLDFGERALECFALSPVSSFSV